MNVLLIAPDVGLESAKQEVRAVSLALNATLLNGTVTRKDVLDTLHAKHWDAVWFATHGDEHGIVLSDARLPTGDLAAIVRNASTLKLLVLNSCSSRNVARDIHYDLDRRIDIICTQTAADDLTAYQTGTLLARNLAAGMSIQAAYEKSRPGNDSLYHLFAHDDHHQEEEESTLLAVMRQEFAKVERRQEAATLKIIAQQEASEQRVTERLEKVEEATRQHDRRIYAMEYASSRTPTFDRWVQVAILIAVLILFGLYTYNRLTGVAP